MARKSKKKETGDGRQETGAGAQGPGPREQSPEPRSLTPDPSAGGPACPACGARAVKVRTVRTRTHPQFLDKLVKSRKREYKCERCGKTWWGKPVTITESEKA